MSETAAWYGSIDHWRWAYSQLAAENLELRRKLPAAAAPDPVVPEPQPERREMRDRRTVVGDSVASESNSWESLIADLTQAWTAAEPGLRYTREHFPNGRRGTFVGHTPADVHDAALSAIIDKLPELLSTVAAAAGSPTVIVPSDDELGRLIYDVRWGYLGGEGSSWNLEGQAVKGAYIAAAAACRAALGGTR